MSRSTSPRMSAAFHPDRRAPRRSRATSTNTSRFSCPIRGPPVGSAAAGAGGAVGGRKPRSVSSSSHRCFSSVPSLGHDLVRPGLGPGPGVPRLPQPRPGLLPGMPAAPLGLVAVGVAADLRRSGAERARIRLQLLDLARGRVEGVAVPGQHCSELGVTGHRCVSDAVDRVQAVADPDGVDPPPRPARPDPGVDLQVQVPVRVTGPGGVVTDHRGLELLHRHLDLPAPRPDPGRGVLGQPPDHLPRRPVLSCVVGRGDLGVHRRGQ